MSTRLSIVVLAASAALALAGCATPQGGTRGLDNASAELAIKSRMLRSDAPFSGVDVKVVDGVALLIGHVPTEEAKEEAGRIAWSAPNVRDVGNEIEVDPRGRTLMGANDQFLLSQVRARLVTDRDIRATSVHIEVYNGVVYLLGRARTLDESRQVADHASRVSGVERVVSFITADAGGVGAPARSDPYDPFETTPTDEDGAMDAGDADDQLLGGPSR